MPKERGRKPRDKRVQEYYSEIDRKSNRKPAPKIHVSRILPKDWEEPYY